ncbi:tRNA dihydrouridine synthase DusB [Thomasclavelia saccharogumia]|uniref:tRNA dihydrouridine synthase DusB n=1 Tax=Thomasclavelia saccharogumia TaxID=341225 RepID=UPI00047E72AD|nr:tRNA dihydrouridine synthase DusB [Thomasclavelia saccharogumia]
MFKIGNVEIENPVVMAPMAGITNMAFRKIIKDFGAGLVYSEMVSDKALCYGNAKTIEMLQVDEGEHPVSIQLFGGEVETMVKAAKFIDQHSNCDIIDINMGCPVNKVLKAEAGSKLLLYPDKIYEIVKGIVENVSKPVTVKIRSGFDKEHINAVKIAELVEKAGASAIAVHGRTRSQMYEGKADWGIIADVKAAVKIPVIGNGDIKSVDDAKRMLAQTNVDAVMIGRAALGNPWLIKQVVESLKTGEEILEPTYQEKIAQCLAHAKKLMEIEPEKVAMFQMRGHAPWYIKGLKSSARVKNELSKIDTYEQLETILAEYKLYLDGISNCCM